MTLDELGPRICVMGPSNSGKSTLAHAIARSRGLSAVHLDQLHHLPNTDWQPRPEAEFVALHDTAILSPRWVIDGNYSRCVPQRLERTTGVILLDVTTVTSLLRYVRRTVYETQRHGTLEGGGERLKWLMFHHIAIITPANRRKYSAMFDRLALPKLRLATPAAVQQFYADERLER